MQYLETLTEGATADGDGDGQSNAVEFTAGTDPRRPTSSLRLTSFAKSGAGSLTLRWPGVGGRIYRVFRSPHPTEGPWTKVSPNLTGTGAEMSFEDSDPVIGERAFYRLEVSLP
jgi:hypothetical protein